MAIGERIKQARLIGRLSLRDLAERTDLSAQAISKYERGMDIPSSGSLLRLAKALHVNIEFFLRPQRVEKITPSYRTHGAMPRKEESALIAKIQSWLDKYLEVDGLRPSKHTGFAYPQGFPCKVRSWSEVERAAEALRKAWQLGLDPIENLTELLEDKGVKVGRMDTCDTFDACTFWASADGEVPVIITKSDLPGDRQRFSLAHELGHLMIKPTQGLDEEQVMHRFAAAFLVPEQAAKFELSLSRRFLDLYELHLLKHKYGISMRAWIYRAKDLEILSESKASILLKQFRNNGWNIKEPGDPYPAEYPQRFELLVMQSLAEDIISEKRAAELLGKPLKQFWSEVAKEHGGLSVDVRYGQ